MAKSSVGCATLAAIGVYACPARDSGVAVSQTKPTLSSLPMSLARVLFLGLCAAAAFALDERNAWGTPLATLSPHRGDPEDNFLPQTLPLAHRALQTALVVSSAGSTQFLSPYYAGPQPGSAYAGFSGSVTFTISQADYAQGGVLTLTSGVGAAAYLSVVSGCTASGEVMWLPSSNIVCTTSASTVILTYRNFYTAYTSSSGRMGYVIVVASWAPPSSSTQTDAPTSTPTQVPSLTGTASPSRQTRAQPR